MIILSFLLLLPQAERSKDLFDLLSKNKTPTAISKFLAKIMQCVSCISWIQQNLFVTLHCYVVNWGPQNLSMICSQVHKIWLFYIIFKYACTKI